MESIELTRARTMLSKACHVRTVIAIVAAYYPKMGFDEQVYFIDEVADRLNELISIHYKLLEGD